MKDLIQLTLRVFSILLLIEGVQYAIASTAADSLTSTCENMIEENTIGEYIYLSCPLLRESQTEEDVSNSRLKL